VKVFTIGAGATTHIQKDAVLVGDARGATSPSFWDAPYQERSFDFCRRLDILLL
jgi:hypothetical protein